MSENPYENYYKSQNTSDSPTSASPQPPVPESYQHPYQRNRYADNLGYNSNIQQTPSVSPADRSYPYTEEFISLDLTQNTQNEVSVPAQTSAFQPETPAVSSDPAFSCEWNGGVYTPETVNPAETSQQSHKPRKKDKRTPIALVLVLCMLVSAVFGVGGAYVYNEFFDDSNQIVSADGLNITQVKPEYYDSDKYADSGMPTADVVERTADSVVEIVTESVQTGSFAQQYIQSGAGSGVIIDREGYIVTNHHVIEGARKITVTLKNGESYDAKLIGSDSKKDLALIQIEAENLTAAVFGDSDKLRVGQRTIAIGNPLGQLGGSVTEGILSALDRELAVDGQTMNLLQTDTAINPGNSGGGLFDANATLIGIVVAKSSGSEVEGLGFAVPVNDVVDVVSDLMQYGYVRGRVSVGMEFLDVTSVSMAWMYGLSDTGCYVYSVSSGSAAASSGIKSGDLVLAVDGKQISTSEDIEAVIEGKTVGDEVEFTIKRSGQTGNITVILSEEVPDYVGESSAVDNSYQWYDFSNYDFSSYN